jgi:hypothetical protein
MYSASEKRMSLSIQKNLNRERAKTVQVPGYRVNPGNSAEACGSQQHLADITESAAKPSRIQEKDRRR